MNTCKLIVTGFGSNPGKLAIVGGQHAGKGISVMTPYIDASMLLSFPSLLGPFLSCPSSVLSIKIHDLSAHSQPLVIPLPLYLCRISSRLPRTVVVHCCCTRQRRLACRPSSPHTPPALALRAPASSATQPEAWVVPCRSF